MIHLGARENDGNRQLGFVARVSNLAVDCILKSKSKGVVHSTFNTSFNLIFGEKIIHIGALENGLAPFGIGLCQKDAQKLTQQISVGQPVRWEVSSQKLIFANGITLSLKQITLKNHSLHNSTYGRKILKENFKFITMILLDEGWQTGLVQTDDEKKEIINSLLLQTDFNRDHPILLEVENLLLLAKGDQETNAEAVFNYWIGRGPGLTPSGDDVITGICAILSLLEGSNRDFLKELSSYLLQHGEKRTTQIGLEYLLYAVKNEYHSHLVKFCELLLKPQSPELMVALKEVGKLGHTSGTDTLIGILLGIQAVITN